MPKATFDSFCYWNLDTKPTDNDTICKAFQWVEIANVVSYLLLIFTNSPNLSNEE